MTLLLGRHRLFEQLEDLHLSFRLRVGIDLRCQSALCSEYLTRRTASSSVAEDCLKAGVNRTAVAFDKGLHVRVLCKQWRNIH